jgi:hypothetical protein
MGCCQHVSWEYWFGFLLLLSLIVFVVRTIQVHEQLGSAVFHGLGRRLWSSRWWVRVEAKDLGRGAGGTVQNDLCSFLGTLFAHRMLFINTDD